MSLKKTTCDDIIELLGLPSSLRGPMDSCLEKEVVSDAAATVELVDTPSPESLTEEVPDAAAAVELVDIPSSESLVEEVEEKPAVRHQRKSTPLGLYFDPNYMDPYLWRTMPMHLVELILSKVPFRNLVTMRRVCKCWNALILSEGFSPPFVPALIMFARTDTVRKMMSERNQPPPMLEAKQPRKWIIFRVWNSLQKVLKRKRSAIRRRQTRFSNPLQRIPNSGILA